MRTLTTVRLILTIFLSLALTRTAHSDTWTVAQVRPDLPVAGRAVAVAVNPTNADIAFVASDGGGLFETTDGGNSWMHIDGIVPSEIHDVSFVPDQPGVIIVTTGGNFPRVDVSGLYHDLNPTGIWRSDDGGRSWRQPSVNISWFEPLNEPSLTCYAGAYGISIGASGRIYVGTDCGLAVSADLGASWTLLPGAPVVQSTSVLAVGDSLYVCTARGLYRSSYRGASWSGPIPVGAAPARLDEEGVAIAGSGDPGGCASSTHALDAAPSNPNVILAVNDANSLFESDDAGASWSVVRRGSVDLFSHIGRSGRAPSVRPGFVRTGPALAGGYELFFGDGVGTFHKMCRSDLTAAQCRDLERYEMQAVSHHMAFHPSNNCADYFVTDNGIYRNAARTSGHDCPAEYMMVGLPSRGYDALQVHEVAAQQQAGRWTDDIYISTQDHGLWASVDGGFTWPGSTNPEGWEAEGLQVASHGDAPGAETIVFGVAGCTSLQACSPTCVSCPRYKTRRGLRDRTDWNNPPGGDLGPYGFSDTSNPALLNPGIFLQIKETSESTNYHAFLTHDAGSSWSDMGRIPSLGLGGLYEEIAIVGPGEHVTVFSPYHNTGWGDTPEQIAATTAWGSPDLGRIDGILDGHMSWKGTYNQGRFGPRNIFRACPGENTQVCPAVYAVDPHNPSYILAVESEGGNLPKVSTDNGDSWDWAYSLSNALRGAERVTSQARVIKFHPNNPAEIFVGTYSHGILYSSDHGCTWEQVSNSEQIPNITGFAFGFDGDSSHEVVYVSSYGRGLWKLRRVPEPQGLFPSECPPRHDPVHINYDPFGNVTHGDWGRGQLVDRRTGGPLRVPLAPEDCPTCTFALAQSGSIRGLALGSDGSIKSIAFDGKLVALSIMGESISPPTLAQFPSKNGHFGGCQQCSNIIAQGGRIDGVLLNGNAVLALVAQMPPDATLTESQLGSRIPAQTTPPSPSAPPHPSDTSQGNVSTTAEKSGATGFRPMQVLSASLKAGTPRYVGACPAGIGFSGSITSDGPGTVKYAFVRSDGAQSSEYEMEFKSAGTQPVQTDWTLGDGHIRAAYKGWVNLKIISPNEMSSYRGPGSAGEFEISCGDDPAASDSSHAATKGTGLASTLKSTEQKGPQAMQVTAVSLKAASQKYVAACPVTVRFSGGIATNGPGVVRYTLLRSDGAQSKEYEMYFKAAGTQPVNTSWTLGDPNTRSSYKGWMGIKITSPNEIASYRGDGMAGEFEVSCSNAVPQ